MINLIVYYHHLIISDAQNEMRIGQCKHLKSGYSGTTMFAPDWYSGIWTLLTRQYYRFNASIT